LGVADVKDRPFGTRPGSRFPPGASVAADGVNFCVFSRHATSVELLLYRDGLDSEPLQTICLAPEENRTFFFWHVFVEGLEPGICYAWRIDGPNDTATTGRSFDKHKLLLDPWARAVSDARWDRRRVIAGLDPGRSEMRAIVARPAVPPTARAAPPALEGAIVYELHVGGFTRDPSSGVRNPGTFAGLIEKIPYLKDLGITHVELLPLMAFDEQDVPDAAFTRGLRNYWGYSTHSFVSPHPRYCLNSADAPREFRALTDAFHAAGIGVLLDVVFNHTAEGGAQGPVINFKGLANDVFYHLDATDKRRYRDYTACGNTVNCNHPLVTGFIVYCLEYWVEQLGVDGFRFDLASVFTRGQDGGVMADPPLPWAIESSRTLAPVPVIAEAWDAAGLYHVGAFPGMAWAEWNGRYRDVMRRFVRGDPNLLAEVASRIAGSADLYADDGRLPCNSVNFITCHDGFTLHDLVSYNGKHNEANGEENRDGSNDNLSFNCSVEGETSDAAVMAQRHRQAKNYVALLMLSRGVPMLLAGDEVLRTQRGNNNAYSQDNEISWFDWRLVDSRRAMLRFVRELIALRRRHPCLTANRFFHGRPVPGRDLPDVTWHGARLDAPGWGDPNGRMLALTIAGTGEEEDLHVILNMAEAEIDVEIPPIADRRWHVAIDTARESPFDVVERARQMPYAGSLYRTRAHSVVALEAR
jgi:glycogen operon protein